MGGQVSFHNRTQVPLVFVMSQVSWRDLQRGVPDLFQRFSIY